MRATRGMSAYIGLRGGFHIKPALNLHDGIRGVEGERGGDGEIV